MSAVFCADCRLWEPCKCTPAHQHVPKRNNALLVVDGLLSAAKFWVGTPGERRKMVQDAIIRFKEIKRLHTERTKMKQ